MRPWFRLSPQRLKPCPQSTLILFALCILSVHKTWSEEERKTEFYQIASSGSMAHVECKLNGYVCGVYITKLLLQEQNKMQTRKKGSCRQHSYKLLGFLIVFGICEVIQTNFNISNMNDPLLKMTVKRFRVFSLGKDIFRISIEFKRRVTW